jgi:hypothetical protein
LPVLPISLGLGDARAMHHRRHAALARR